MAYVALASDLNGSIVSIDHKGRLRYNSRLAGGFGPLAENGLGRVIGDDWSGITQLGASRANNHLVLAGVTTDGDFVSATIPVPVTNKSFLVKPMKHLDGRWAAIREMCGGPNAKFFGIDANGKLLRFGFRLVGPGRTGARRAGQGIRTTTAVPGDEVDFGPGFGDLLVMFTNGSRIFGVTHAGTLQYLHGFDPMRLNRRRVAKNARRWVALEAGWTGYQRAFAADDSGIYTISKEGELGLRRFIDSGGDVRLLPETGEPIGVGVLGWLSLPSLIEAYCWPQSAPPGGRISFKVATRLSPPPDLEEVRYRVDFVRLRRLKNGREGDYDRVVKAGPRDLIAERRPLPEDWLESGAQWPEAFALKVPRRWPSGAYAVRTTDEMKRRFYVPFVVRRSSARRPFAVLANTHTWAAYNVWGGEGKYVHEPPMHPRALPFERPHPGLAPGPGEPGDEVPSELLNHTLHLLRAELWILGWLEGLGSKFGFDLFTDGDLHRGIPRLRPGSKRRYKALILNTHPEYWTPTMYKRVKAYQDAGGSILYLGANGVFEEVELDNGRPQQVRVFPDVDWSQQPCQVPHEVVRKLCLNRARGRPERALFGVGFEEVATNKGQPFQLVLHPHESPALRGLPLAAGDEIGAESVAKGFRANGWEVDRRGKSTPPQAKAETALLATGKCSRQSGEMLYYETGRGGVVFTASSLTFGGSLVVDRHLQRIVTNVLRICLKR